MENEFNPDIVAVLEEIASIDPNACDRIMSDEDSRSDERFAAEDLKQEILDSKKLLADVHSNSVRPNVAHALIDASRSVVFILLDNGLSRWQGTWGIPEEDSIFSSWVE